MADSQPTAAAAAASEQVPANNDETASPSRWQELHNEYVHELLPRETALLEALHRLQREEELLRQVLDHHNPKKRNSNQEQDTTAEDRLCEALMKDDDSTSSSSSEEEATTGQGLPHNKPDDVSLLDDDDNLASLS